MSLRSKTLIFLGILIILAALIIGTYHELIVNAASQNQSDAPLLTPEIPGSGYPAAVDKVTHSSLYQLYPYPPPNTTGKMNVLPGIPARKPF